MHRKCPNGFTAIEVISVLLVLGILTAIAIVRISGSTEIKSKAATEVVKGHIRYAQAQAINMGGLWGIECQGNQLWLFRGIEKTKMVLPGEEYSDPTNPVVDLSEKEIDTITDFLFYFDNWGCPYGGEPVLPFASSNELSTEAVITVNGEHNFSVIPKTGYVQ